MKEKQGNIRWFYSGLWYCLLFLLTIQSLHAQFTISEDFKGSGNPEIIIGDDAYLTSGIDDPVGAGWLRLTEAKTNQKGYAYVNKSFPSRLGVLVDFEYTMWRDVYDGYNGADGFTIFLFDANYGPGTFRLGAYGGSLGYANSSNEPKSAGLTGGYLGIGFDAYGNFVRSSEGKNEGSSNISPNSIVLRGPTISSNSTNTDTNRYLKGVTLTENGNTHDALNMLGVGNEDIIDYNTPTSSRPSQDVFYRRVQAEIVPTSDGKFKITVRWIKQYGETFTDLLTYTTEDVPPEFLKLGFAASTGGGFNYHEIRNMLVSTPGNLRVHKSASKDIMRSVPGEDAENGSENGIENEVSFKIEITNDTATDLSKIDVLDQFTDGSGDPIPLGMFVITSITTENFMDGTVSLPNVPINDGLFTGSVGLIANSTGTITVEGYLNGEVPIGNVLNNTVTVSNDVITDLDEENNTSTVSVPVITEGVDLVVEKKVDNYCLNPDDGNTFTITVGNMGVTDADYSSKGGHKKEIKVVDKIPEGVTMLNFSHDGWDHTSTGSTHTFILKGSGTLRSAMTLPPIIYTIKNSSPFDTESEVQYMNITNNGSTNLESDGKGDNNIAFVSIVDQPSKPEFVNPANSTIYYCQGDSASPLDVYIEEADSGNTMLWYTTKGGSSLLVAPTPNTSTAGSSTYYVSQSNGNCESELTEIKIVVLAKPTAGEIAGAGEVCVNSVPGLLTNVSSGTGVGSEGLTYRWEYSIDNGLTWMGISGQVGESYQPDTIKTNMQYRRITIASIGDVLCESEPSNVITVAIKDCMILSNPMLPSKAKK